jgi:hypothetical protein
MRKELSFLLIIFSPFLLCTCDFETAVEISIPEEKKKLVVNCIFQVDSTVYPRFFHSENILSYQHYSSGDTTDNAITNAVAKLHSGDTEIPILFYKKYPFYRSASKATGNEYTIEVSAPGYESVTATTTIPRPVQITEIQSGDLMPPPSDDLMGKRAIHVRFKDPADESNYYGISIYVKIKDSRLGVSLLQTLPTPLNPVYAEDYYAEDFRSGGYIHQEYSILFNDRLFNGLDNVFSVWCYEGTEEDVSPWSGEVQGYVVILKSISEEYYNYRVTYNLQQKAKRDPYAQPVQVFNNINNGFGIFAGYSISRVEHKIR